MAPAQLDFECNKKKIKYLVYFGVETFQKILCIPEKFGNFHLL